MIAEDMLTWYYVGDKLIHDYENIQRRSVGIVESVENPKMHF